MHEEHYRNVTVTVFRSVLEPPPGDYKYTRLQVHVAARTDTWRDATVRVIAVTCKVFRRRAILCRSKTDRQINVKKL